MEFKKFTVWRWVQLDCPPCASNRLT